MDGVRDELLADAGLALDEHGEVRGRDEVDRLQDLAHGRARRGELGRPLRLQVGDPLEGHVLGREALLPDGLSDDEEEVLAVDRLRDVVEGARLHDLHDGVHRRVPACDDDLEVRGLLLDPLEELEPVQALQEEVGDKYGDRFATRDLERGVAIPGTERGVAVRAQSTEQELAKLVFTFNDQDRRLVGHFSWQAPRGNSSKPTAR